MASWTDDDPTYHTARERRGVDGAAV